MIPPKTWVFCMLVCANQSRTGLNGFAGRDITALLSRHLHRVDNASNFPLGG